MDWVLEDLGSIVVEDDEEEDPFSAHSLLFQDLSLRLVTNPYYLFTTGVSDIGVNLKRWTKKDLEAYLGAAEGARPRRKKEIVSLEYAGFASEEIANFFTEAFIHIEVGLKGWSRAATICIRGAKIFAKHCEGQGFHSDYLRGVDYLSRWALLQIYVRKGKIPRGRDGVWGGYDAVREYDALPDRGKAVVLASKAFLHASFRRQSRDAGDKATSLLREIVGLDPSFEWYYRLGNWIRCSRRRERSSQQGPCDEEISILTKSYEAALALVQPHNPPARINAVENMALAGMCQVVAEMIKSRMFTKQTDFPVRLGSLVFNNDQEMVDFVLTNVKKMNNDEVPTTFAELIRSGEILSNILPHQYRDYGAAETYFQKALKILPKNSKVHHKLGVLYLLSDAHRDIPKAIEILWEAVHLEPSNFPAAMDLIHAMLGDPKKLEEEVEELVTQLIRDTVLSPKDKSQLHFAQGTLKFLIGEVDDAVPFWITAQLFNPEDNMFLCLNPNSKRYGWNRAALHFYKIREALIKYAEDHSLSPGDNQGFDLLMKHLETHPHHDRPERRVSHHQFQQQQRKISFTKPRTESESDNDWRRSANPLPPPSSSSKDDKPYMPPSRRVSDAGRGPVSWKNEGFPGQSSSYQNTRRTSDAGYYHRRNSSVQQQNGGGPAYLGLGPRISHDLGDRRGQTNSLFGEGDNNNNGDRDSGSWRK